jgi:uncharacterized protein YbjT (DUF2867 family)
MNGHGPIVVTGATGYVGGRLVPRLLEAGHDVRAVVRAPERLAGRAWLDKVEVVRGDVLEPETLVTALAGASVAYYLIHSMGAGEGFHQRDLDAARSFGAAARDAGIEKIVYLSGLGDPDETLSDHLRSRHATGDALREAGVPVVELRAGVVVGSGSELRAGVVVGSGSLSFEMVRNLTERLPMMICPRWVYTRTQPIAIRNVLEYLVAAAKLPVGPGHVIEIGGADQLSYGDMISRYAGVRRLRRFLIPVPVLTPRLSSYWVHWMTPVSAGIVRPLVEGLRNESVVRDPRPARDLFPGIQPMGYDAAVRRALRRLEDGELESSWCDALRSSLGDEQPVVLDAREGMLVERRQVTVDVPAERLYRAFTGLGGRRGWLTMNWAWRLRGALDRMIGGVGFRRGRRHPSALRVGDALDFWRVEALESGRLMRLRAEMKLPGRAWLEFKAEPQPGGRTRLTQTALFGPRGLLGLMYWYAMYPAHSLIFSSMIRRVARLGATLTDEPATVTGGAPA